MLYALVNSSRSSPQSKSKALKRKAGGLSVLKLPDEGLQGDEPPSSLRPGRSQICHRSLRTNQSASKYLDVTAYRAGGASRKRVPQGLLWPYSHTSLARCSGRAASPQALYAPRAAPSSSSVTCVLWQRDLCARSTTVYHAPTSKVAKGIVARKKTVVLYYSGSYSQPLARGG
jgi:hypothetical protein